MIFSKQYELAIRKAVNSKRFDIYNAQHQDMFTPGTLDKFLVPPLKIGNEWSKRTVQLPNTHDLSLKVPYVILPKKDLFRGHETMDSRALDYKVLKAAKSCKPIVKYFLNHEILDSFVLDESYVRVNLEYNPRYRKDKEPQKKHSDIVSYVYFVDMLDSLERPDSDKFVD